VNNRRRELEQLHIETQLRRCATDFRFFLRFVAIEDKTSRTGLAPFVPLPHQQATIDSLLKDRQMIVLKARQLGLTTVIMSYVLWQALFRPGFTALVLSHKDEYAKANVSRLRLMYANLPGWMRQRLPQPNQASNSFVLEFANGQSSTVMSMPATAKVGASLTLDMVFLDEYGLMEYADQAYDTLKPALDAAMASQREGCVLAVCSTARGSANAFARMWRANTSMTKLFFPWSCSPNFAQGDYDREADDYAAKGEPWRIYQERPANPEEAFRKSGSNYFPNLPNFDDCDEFPAHLRGRIIETDDGELSFVADPFGPLRLAEETPDRHSFYVLAVDPAHGTGNDATVGVVTSYDDAGDPYVAAYWTSNTTGQADAATELDLLGRWFAGAQDAALLVVETTGGHAELFIHVWRSREYPNLYSFLSPSNRRRRLAPSYGINTAGTGGKRNLVLGRLAECLPRLVNLYPTLREELGTFVRRDGTEFAAADVGCHDDHVLAAALSIWALTERGHAPRRPMGETAVPHVATISVNPLIEAGMAEIRRVEQERNDRWARQMTRRHARTTRRR
jgi:hypothetical protein